MSVKSPVHLGMMTALSGCISPLCSHQQSNRSIGSVGVRALSLSLSLSLSLACAHVVLRSYRIIRSNQHDARQIAVHATEVLDRFALAHGQVGIPENGRKVSGFVQLLGVLTVELHRMHTNTTAPHQHIMCPRTCSWMPPLRTIEFSFEHHKITS